MDYTDRVKTLNLLEEVLITEDRNLHILKIPAVSQYEKTNLKNTHPIILIKHFFLPVQLFSEVLQRRWNLWGTLLRVDLYISLF